MGELDFNKINFYSSKYIKRMKTEQEEKFAKHVSDIAPRIYTEPLKMNSLKRTQIKNDLKILHKGPKALTTRRYNQHHWSLRKYTLKIQ